MMEMGLKETQAALALPVKTAREKDYIAALAVFFKDGKEEYPKRGLRHTRMRRGNCMRSIRGTWMRGRFMRLSLLAAENPDDLTQTQERKAMLVLTPLFAKYPDQSGGGALHRACLR